jgi:hypothetical protein
VILLFSGFASSDVQANYASQQQNSYNFCGLAVSGPSSSMYTENLLNHRDYSMSEQRATVNPPFLGTEVPFHQELLESSERINSDMDDLASTDFDEKDLMTWEDSFASLTEKDTVPFPLPVPGHIDATIADEVGPPGARTIHVEGPPAISRMDSFNDLLQNLPPM